MSSKTLDEEAIFKVACRIPSPEARQEYLQQICGQDPQLSARVAALLGAYFEEESFLESPGADYDATVDPGDRSDRVGAQIGPFRLVEQIGEGGMGVVYLAEQKRPLRRTVALKVIRRGMDTAQVVARFEAERQALALMNHPNIARVLDAGATDDGRLFFVMDLVRGIPITEYCDQKKLSPRERLELFVTVCQAVQHAHQKGVIHRDLKPSNILVELHDVTHVPKVIDFGVAKATSQRLTDRTLVTQFSQMIGTPLYMSPEQAELSGLDVDTRSDIYSLGVLLYELLTGTTPFDRETFHKASLDEMRRMIREDVPPRPSHRISTLNAERLTTLAERQRADAKQLRRAVERELDWIVMKTLEKDRARRYESAAALAADVQRYLDDEPVLACPPSVSYRLQKYASRHKAALVTMASLGAVLMAATVVSSALAAWAVGERRLAQTHLSEAKRNERVANQERAAALHARALAERQGELANQRRDEAEYDAYLANIQLADRNLAKGSSPLEPLAAVTPELGRPDIRSWEWYYLYSQAHRPRYEFPFQRFKGYIVGAAWSPDGNSLATLDATGPVNIWNVRNGRLRHSLKGGSAGIGSLSWSPNGLYVAAGTDRSLVHIWEVESATLVRSLRGNGVGIVDWHPDSLRLASGGKDGSIYLWNARTGERLSSWYVNAGPVNSLDWHPDGVLLAANSGPAEAKVLKVWDSVTDREVMDRTVNSGGVRVRFSPDGRRLLYDGGRALRMIDVASQALVWSYPDYTFSHTWSPDGRHFAANTNAGGLNIWDSETGTLLSSTPVIGRSTWSPRGGLLATYRPGLVQVGEALPRGDPASVFSTPRRARSVAFSPDGRRLLVGTDSLARMWNFESGSEILSIISDNGRGVAFSPDGARFAATSGYSGVKICDAETGNQLLPGLAFAGEHAVSVAWSPDGKALAVLFGTNQRLERVKIFNARTADLVATSSYFEGRQNKVAWSPDGQRLAATADGGIRFWDAALREESWFKIPESALGRGLDWSPCGTYLAAGYYQGVWIYDAAVSKPVRLLASRRVHSVAWHPTMPRLASCGEDGMVRLWDTVTGREVYTLDFATDGYGWVTHVTWSPDGLQLAATSVDGGVRVWDGSAADEYLKRHGDLRDEAAQLVRRRGFSDLLETRRRYQDALEILQRLCTLHPQDRELTIQTQRVTWRYAMELAIDERLSEATAMFDKLRADSADVPDYRLHLPARLFAAAKHEAAIAMAEKFVAESPDRREYRDELAFLYESRATELCAAGQFEEAAVILRRLAEGFSERPDFRGQLVFEMAKLDRMKETIATFEKLAEAFNGWPDYRPPLARRLSDAREHDLAALIYERLTDDYPDAAEYQMQLNLQRAQIMIADDRPDEAIDLLSETNPSDAAQPTLELLANAYLARARNYLVANDIDNAIADLSPAFEMASDRVKSRVGYELALAQLAEGRVEEYRATCLQMHKQFGDSQEETDAHWLSWTCALSAGATADYASAIAAAEVALGSDAHSVSFLTSLGAVLLRSGQYDKAVVHLAQAGDLAESASNSSPAYIWYFLAMVHHHLEQEAVATEWLNKANARAQEELGTDQEPKDALWNRRLTLNLLRAEAERLLATVSDE